MHHASQKNPGSTQRKQRRHAARLAQRVAAQAFRGLENLEERRLMAGDPIGDTIANAATIGTVTQFTSVNASLEDFRDVDLFAVNVQAGKRYSFDIDTDGSLNTVLRLFDANGRPIAINDNGRSIDEKVSRDSFISGMFRTNTTIYVGVSALGNHVYNANTGANVKDATTSGDYSLTVTFLSPTDTAGGTLKTAADLGVLASTAAATEFVNAFDRTDTFKFTLEQDGHVAIDLSAYSADLNLTLIKDGDNNGLVRLSEIVGKSHTVGFGAEKISMDLTAGTYHVQVVDRIGESWYELSLSATFAEPEPEPTPEPTPEPEPQPEPQPAPTPAPEPAPTPAPVNDFFSQNFTDSQLIALARSLFADGSLSRTDVIAIVRNAGDDDHVVSSGELSDLRKMVGSAGILGMSDSVRVLLNKVVNSNVANAMFQGAALGNLAAGSSEAQLDKLVDKWYFGADRPDATLYNGQKLTYRQANGQLFVNGASFLDIEQGAVGDCYLVATLGSVAKIDPNAITQMFTDNGDGTFTVRFFKNGVADFVTVDTFLPTNGSGQLMYASMGKFASSSANELWVPLAEKAYAQLNEEGYIGQDGTNSYSGIEGGWMENVYEQVLGRNASSSYMPSKAFLINALNSNKMVTLGSNSSTSSGVIGGHAYILLGYNAATDKFDLHNPWATQHAYGLTFEQVAANFSWAAVA